MVKMTDKKCVLIGNACHLHVFHLCKFREPHAAKGRKRHFPGDNHYLCSTEQIKREDPTKLRKSESVHGNSIGPVLL